MSKNTDDSTLLCSDPARALIADIAIIAALMTRLKLTEAYIKPEEIPKQSRGLNVIPDDSGGYTVVLLEPDIANAFAESQGRVKS